MPDTLISFAEGISIKPPQPFTPNYSMLGNTMDPTNMWPASMDRPKKSDLQPHAQSPVQPSTTLQMHRSSLSSSPATIAQRRNTARGPQPSLTPSSTPVSTTGYGRSLSAQASTPASMISKSPDPTSPIESEKTLRARYAANQRHSKAKQARKDSHQNESPSEADTKAAVRKQRHREKNKVAAAKCRSRQRKQVQTIQEKGSRLEEKNLQLKTMIQELRGELNTLRSMALDHQQCNCSVARYNHDQAERVVAEYRSSCLGQAL